MGLSTAAVVSSSTTARHEHFQQLLLQQDNEYGVNRILVITPASQAQTYIPITHVDQNLQNLIKAAVRDETTAAEERTPRRKPQFNFLREPRE